MGWNARAIGVEVDWLNPVPVPGFEKASARVEKEFGSVDGELQYGSLCLRACNFAQIYLGPYEIDEHFNLSPSGVVEALEGAKWPDAHRLDHPTKIGIASLRAFFETCAKLGLGVHFSY